MRIQYAHCMMQHHLMGQVELGTQLLKQNGTITSVTVNLYCIQCTCHIVHSAYFGKLVPFHSTL